MRSPLRLPVAAVALALAGPSVAQGAHGAHGALFWRDRNLVLAATANDPFSALARLCAGPTAAERQAGFATAIPPGTRLLAVRVQGASITIVLDATFVQAIAAGGAEAALEQLSKTALASGTATTVHVRVVLADGREVDSRELLLGPPLPAPEPVAGFGTDSLMVSGALSGRRIAVSPGHGYYWHSTLGWTTQRGNIDGLIEDIHTAEICNHYLVPMLANLGAHVLECREHADLDSETLGDNDAAVGYAETGGWSTSASSGWNGGTYRFAGTALVASASATWTLPVPADGVYAAYAWFRAGSNRATDARYTVLHSGGESAVLVDQTVDNSTFVWLGDYFATTAAPLRIRLDNMSAVAGRVVIADVVRLGGGRGSIARGGVTSNQARWRECARYWAQFAGAPASVWDSIAGGEDNDDDVTCRPRFAEWRTADAFVSLHTNAGGGDGTSSYIHDTAPSAGSALLQQRIHSQIIADLRAEYDPAWTDRGQLAANFGEVRLLSTMPGTLIELAFHDTPGSVDHRALHDPRFRYLAARAIARGVLRYFSPLAPFPPEPPTALRVVQDGGRGLRVAWDPAPGATGYGVEQSPDGKNFTEVARLPATSWSTGPLPYHSTLSFRVRAWNGSGRSVATEVLTAGTDHNGQSQALLVQAFDRFDRAVKFPDNTRDYLRRYGSALRAQAPYSLGFDAASNEAVLLGRVALGGYRAVVWACGEESTVHETFAAGEQALVQAYLAAGGRLLVSGAEIAWDLDAQGSAADRAFYRTQLGASYQSDDAAVHTLQAGIAGTVSQGLPAATFDDGTHGTYDVDWPDVLAPADAQSSVCLRYGNGLVAGIQRNAGSARVVNFGFPLETIVDDAARAQLLQQSLAFLLAPMPISAPAVAPLGQRWQLRLAVPADAGLPYLTAVSDAFAPGIALPGGGVLPLRYGFLIDASLNPANPFFGDFLGTLDAAGAAAPWIDVPVLPALAGMPLWAAALTMPAGGPLVEQTVTNWVRTVIQ